MRLEHRCNAGCQPARDRHFETAYVNQLDFPRAEEALRLRLRSDGLRLVSARRAPDAAQDQLPKRERWQVEFEPIEGNV